MSLTVEKCLQAWTNSLRQMNAKADTVFFGDSLTYYGDFASVFPDKVVCNLGLRGDTIQGMIDRVEQVLMLEPKQVFLMAGINDVSHVTAEEFEMLYIRLIDAIIQGLPKVTLVVQSMLPVNTLYFSISCDNGQIRACNSKIQMIAEARKLNYQNIHSLYEENGQLPFSFTRDGLHLIDEAYERWYKVLAKIGHSQTIQ
jgi:lysophospholipase L1-like esterase